MHGFGVFRNAKIKLNNQKIILLKLSIRAEENVKI